MSSVPPGDPRRNVVPPSDDPQYDPWRAAQTPLRESTRRVGIATLIMMLLGVLALAVIVVL
jgi:hypothetical protein